MKYKRMVRDYKIKATLYRVVYYLIGDIKRKKHAPDLPLGIGTAHNAIVVPLLGKVLGDALTKQLIKLFYRHKNSILPRAHYMLPRLLYVVLQPWNYLSRSVSR